MMSFQKTPKAETTELRELLACVCLLKANVFPEPVEDLQSNCADCSDWGRGGGGMEFPTGTPIEKPEVNFNRASTRLQR